MVDIVITNNIGAAILLQEQAVKFASINELGMGVPMAVLEGP